MAPVTVLVPNNIAGIVTRRHLAHGLTKGGNGVAGIWFTTLPRLAEQLSAPTLTGQGRRPATRPVTAAAHRDCLDKGPGGFAKVKDHPATARALANASRQLRDIGEEALANVAAASALNHDVVRLHSQTTQALAAGWYDQTDLLSTATMLIESGAANIAALGTVVLYLPQDPSRAETAFASALQTRTDFHVVLGHTGSARADLGPFIAATCETPAEDPSSSAPEPTAARLLTASDSDDEVRCVVREVVHRLTTTPGHRIAVLYAARSPYARLLHEHLGAAGINVNGPGVRPVNERAIARLVAGLLELARTGYRRADVMRVLGEIPIRDFTGERVSVPRWERASREAGVVQNDDWDTRLTTYVQNQIEKAAGEGAWESTKERARRNRDAAAALGTFMQELRSRLTLAAQATTWADLAKQFSDLLDTLAPQTARERMPLEEQYAAGVLDRTLAGLSALDLGAAPRTPSVVTLEELLALEFESALPRVGRFGEGVLVAPITHAVGLDLDAIWLVGLSEDLYPGRLHEDSLLSERVRALTAGQLPSTRATHDVKQRALLAAFQSAADVTVSFPRGDLRRHTHRLPSRWLLPTLRTLSGNPDLAATEFDKASGDWLGESPSYAGSVTTTPRPATDQEWRLCSMGAGAMLDDDTVAAAREMVDARDSSRFTRFDGNLTDVEGLPNPFTDERTISPTALER